MKIANYYWRKSYHSGVAINEENELSETDVASSPGSSLIRLNYFLHSDLVKLVLFIDSDLSGGVFLFEFGKHAEELILNTNGEIQTVVHVTRFLELTLAEITILLVRWASTPTNIVCCVISFAGPEITLDVSGRHCWKLDNLLCEFLADNLHSVLVNVDRSGTTDTLVVLDGSLDTLYSWDNDTIAQRCQFI